MFQSYFLPKDEIVFVARTQHFDLNIEIERKSLGEIKYEQILATNYVNSDKMSSDNNCPATELLATDHHRTARIIGLQDFHRTL